MIAAAQGWLFETVVQPLLFAFGWMTLADSIYDLTEWVVLGAIEIVVLAIVLGALERRWPVEPVIDHAAIRVDIIYTVLHRLGLFAILSFAVLTPLIEALESRWRLAGFSRPNFEQSVPWLDGSPLLALLAYLVLFDLVDYGFHRASHRFHWWWQLHAVHHSQRQMTFWSDSRNHLLDSLLRDAVLALVAVVVGVPPGQFVVLTILTRVLESLQHTNLRLRFPGWLEWLFVSPSFHRRHHAIGFGHEGRTHGVNFAVLFPLWDHLFGTADRRSGFVATGIRDQLSGRDYGRGFWSQQWLAFTRMRRATAAMAPTNSDSESRDDRIE
ncbi:MAG: sterol desaturase family protein [Burkholderiaceae bacterium]